MADIKKNKHSFSPNGHDPKTFDKFCEVASKFEAYDLLYIIIQNWCDDSDLEDIATALSDRLEENGL